MNYKAPQLILHIGFAKTGTTALQHALFEQRGKILKNYATLYPGKFENHYFFQALVAEQPATLIQVKRLGLPNGAAIADFLETYRQEVLSEINEVKPQRIIISSEYFSSMSLNELQALRSFLETIAENIVLFAYVRDPWSQALSANQELIRSGLSQGGEIKINYRNSNVPLLTKFEAAFGRPPIVVPYLGTFNVVEDFCQRFDLGSLASDALKYKGINKSMLREAACLMLHFNQLYPRFDENGNYISDVARDRMAKTIQNTSLHMTPITLSTRTAKKIYEAAQPEIELLEEKYFAGQKVFSEKYHALQTTEADDTLSISMLKPEQVSEYLLSSMYLLSQRLLEKEQSARALALRLAEIENSREWKIGLFLRRIRLFLIPMGSRRAQELRRLINFLKNKKI